MMTQFFAQLGTLTYFSLKKAEIAEAFCVNKDKPDACCEGKCYLGKQLGGLEKEQDAGVSENELPYFLITQNDFSLLHYSFSDAVFQQYTNCTLKDFNSETEKPPKAV